MNEKSKASGENSPSRHDALRLQALLGQAASELSSHRPERAREILMDAERLAPHDVKVLRLRGVAERFSGDADQAVCTLGRALAVKPDDPWVLMDLGIAEFEQGRHAQAVARMEEACRHAPNMPALWFNLGKLSSLCGADEKAASALVRTLDLDAGHIPARYLLADIAFKRGRGREAVRHFRSILQLQPFNAKAWIGLSNVKTERFTEADAKRLREAIALVPATSEARAELGFTLSRVLEDTGHFDDAFQALGEANRIMASKVQWQPGPASDEVDSIIDTFHGYTPPPQQEQRGAAMIFLVSLPRSGSTLIEQILSSHEDVHGGGELTTLPTLIEEESKKRGIPFHHWAGQVDEETWSRLGQAYLERTRKLRGSSARVTDKNLLNWRFVGAIRAMFPAAKIINCRRDPLDTCLAGFRQLFNAGSHFSYDLRHMANRWHDYDRACTHWKRLFGDDFYEVHLEDLIATPESEVRKLLAYCGLPFSSACLSFHENDRMVQTASAVQVRQPLRHGVPLSQRYGKNLDALRGWLKNAPAGRANDTLRQSA